MLRPIVKSMLMIWGKLETREDYKRVADKLREVMGWKGPVDVATIRAFREIGVEAKRARTDIDIGDRPKLRRLRTDVGEGSSGSGGNTPNRSVDEDEIMEDAERPIAKLQKSKSTLSLKWLQRSNRQEGLSRKARNLCDSSQPFKKQKRTRGQLSQRPRRDQRVT